jgi:uncharacterized membrane protein
MQFSRSLLSGVIVVGGLGAATTIASARYGGGPQHTIIISLLLTAVVCILVLAALYFLMPPKPVAVKVAIYSLLTLAAACALLMRDVGFDGILPMSDGAQSIGIAAVGANADLFSIVIVTIAIACWRCFRMRR